MDLNVIDINVWIVEDEDLYRTEIADLIDETGGMYCPHAFPSCEALIAALEAQTEDELPAIILMDISLPGGMNGVEGAARVKALLPTTQVIMLTIHEEDDTVFDALRAGASGYLLKNVSEERLIEGIREARRGGVPMTSAIARKVLNLFRQQATPGVDYGLTKREKEILHFLVDGHQLKQIAEELFVSRHTVDSHIRNIYAKLHVHSRARAVVKAVREGLI